MTVISASVVGANENKEMKAERSKMQNNVNANSQKFKVTGSRVKVTV